MESIADRYRNGLTDGWHAAAGVRRFPLRVLACAELSATAKTCSMPIIETDLCYTRLKVIALRANCSAMMLFHQDATALLSIARLGRSAQM
jgi:hypothetical protein